MVQICGPGPEPERSVLVSVFLWKKNLTYVSIPKVACTSIKHMFFEIENGRPFQPFKISGQFWHIHNFYRGYAFEDLPHPRIAEHRRLTVVRDPLQRVLSCYSNRVVHHRKLAEPKALAAMAAAGLNPKPDLGAFLDQFQEYRAVSQDVLHHSRPQIWSIGQDPGFYHRVYALRDLADFVADVGTHLGRMPVLGRHQSEGPKFTTDDITAPQRARLMEFFAEDYRIWGQYF